MLYGLLEPSIPGKYIVVIASFIAFTLTFIMMALPFSFLPRDGGKFVKDKNGNVVEVNQNSKGKVTGVGLIMISIVLVMCFLFFSPNAYDSMADKREYGVSLIIIAGMMMVGYLDDASKNPWGELLKGLLDLGLSLIAAISFVLHNPTDIKFLWLHFHIPAPLYAILAVALIWGSINVTNCSDGIDGLCGTVSLIEIFAYLGIFGRVLGIYSAMGIVLSFVIVAYLAYNWNPSTVLMGDAGSRPIGFFLALLAMKSGHPFVFVLLSFVFLFDGGLGLLKLALLRTVKINLFKNILLPFHDHLRKNVGWKIPKIVIFFSLAEALFAIITTIIIKTYGV